MAVVGYMGATGNDGIVFQVSDVTLITLKNFKWSGSAKYAIHNRHNNNALTEFVGLDPDKITFDIQLKKDLGINPMQEILKLWSYERNGIAVALVVGSHCYGKYRWSITNHDTTVKSTDARGNITDAVVSVTLQEYLPG